MSTHAGGRGSTPRQVSAEEMCDLLAGFIAQKNPNGATPSEEQLVELTRWINRYLLEPWDEASIGRYRKADAIARHERETLDEAAAILKRDLNELKALNGVVAATVRQRIANLETAIAALDSPRGWFEQGLPRFAARGPDKKPWAIMAQKIVQETLAAMQAAQRMNVEKLAADAAEAARRTAMPAGEDAASEAFVRTFAGTRQREMRNVQKTVGASNGPVIKFTAEVLKFIMPQGRLPAPATILDAVTKVTKR
jgi:hypothetical protein